MEVKAEFIHIVPISITFEYPLKQLLEKINTFPNEDLFFTDVSKILSESFKNFTEENHLLFFIKSKLLFEKDVKNISYLNIRKQTIKKNWLKILLIFHLAKNRQDFTKQSHTSWNNQANLDDSFISQTPRTPNSQRLLIPNFLKSALVLTELKDPKLMADFSSVVSGCDKLEIIPNCEKRNFLEVDYSDYIEITHLTNKVITLENLKKKKLLISECSNASIYFSSTFEMLIITKCKNCEIFIPGVRRIALIEHSSDLNVTIITRALHLSNVSDSRIHSYTSFEPELLGEINNVQMGPFNANFANLLQTLETIGVELKKEFIDTFSNAKQFYKCQEFLTEGANSHGVIGLTDFERLILPKEFGFLQVMPLLNNEIYAGVFPEIVAIKELRDYPEEIIPVLTPKTYFLEMIRRFESNKELMALIIAKKLGKNEKEILLDVIQGYFREWLVTRSETTGGMFRMLNNFKN